jgi:hypothetical protein
VTPTTVYLLPQDLGDHSEPTPFNDFSAVPLAHNQYSSQLPPRHDKVVVAIPIKISFLI